MAAAFPATPSSPSYGSVSPSTRCGIYYGPLSTPAFTVSESGSDTYQVRNWDGDVVSSGSVSGTTCAPVAPGGGWLYGWYRLYLFDGSGLSSGACNFCVIRDNSDFVTNPASGTDGGSNGVALDEVTRGVFALGPQRYAVADTASPSSYISDILAATAIDATYNNGDANRPQPSLCEFPNGATYDGLALTNSALGGQALVVVYCKDGTVSGADVTITVAAGSVSGFKVVVGYKGTPEETYDNLATTADLETATKTSSYVRAFSGTYGVYPSNLPDEPSTATAIGDTNFTAVESIAAALYPNIEWFEGPINEPGIGSPYSSEAAELVQHLILMRAAVTAGAAGAKVLGPGLVSANLEFTAPGVQWDSFLAAVAVAEATAIDGISFHAYNTELGDLSMMRSNLSAFTALVTNYGLGDLPLWQTEQGVFTPVYGVYHPRRARWSMLQILLQESFGIPKERNHLWYDISHGFWDQPTWWENVNTGLNPQAVMLRTFAEEVFGKNFASGISLGAIGDHMYFGGLWTNPGNGASVAVFMGASPMANSQVTVTVAGTSTPLTAIDTWGNSSTIAQIDGRVTLPVGDSPAYLVLPSGVSVTPYSINDWAPDLFSAQENLCQTRTQHGTSSVANDVWENGYDGGTAYPYAADPPDDSVVVTFRNPQRFDRCVIWNGMVWQADGTLTDFDLQTSNDGSTWTTRATVTVPPPTTLEFVTDYTDVGCTVETYWPEQWIFDIALPSPAVGRYVRLNTRTASYGGEPDARCIAVGGQGTSNETFAIAEVALLLGASPLVRFPITLG